MELTMSDTAYFENIGHYIKKIDCYRDAILNMTLLDIPYENKKLIFEEINKLYKNLEKSNKGGNND